jgi:transcriptional regulator with XRE-family HTH domain
MGKHELDEVVGRQIRAARKMLWPSQEILAQRLTDKGVPMHQATIARLERGERNITIADLFAIAATLEITPLHLLAGTYTNEAVPVLPTRPPDVPARMIAWIRGEVALPGMAAENFAAVLPSSVLDAHLRSGIQNLETILREYRDAHVQGSEGRVKDALNDLIHEADRQVADLKRLDNSITKEIQNDRS